MPIELSGMKTNIDQDKVRLSIKKRDNAVTILLICTF